MKPAFLLASVLYVAVLGGCATKPPAPVERPALSCAAGERPADVVQLFFGRNIGDKPGVSEADWDLFFETQIVSRFPEGASVIDTEGVWRGKDGMAVHELGKAVVVVMPDDKDDNGRIIAITDAYKTRFSQDSVLTSRSRSCVAF